MEIPASQPIPVQFEILMWRTHQSYLWIRVPKIRWRTFCMLSVHSHLHCSISSKRSRSRAVSANSVSVPGEWTGIKRNSEGTHAWGTYFNALGLLHLYLILSFCNPSVLKSSQEMFISYLKSLVTSSVFLYNPFMILNRLENILLLCKRSYMQLFCLPSFCFSCISPRELNIFCSK